jgi:subfamily B ATP-binding cassette protein HlyB/CyaB
MQRPQDTGGIDTGLHALVLMARFHHLAGEPGQLIHRRGKGAEPFSDEDLLHAARDLGLKARLVVSTPERLASTPLPAMVQRHDGRWLVLARREGGKCLVQDPARQGPDVLADEDFLAAWNGRAILIASRASLAGELARFDFSWFIPALVRYRTWLRDIFIASFVLQLLALLSPLIFQVVIDKVIGHQSLNTLDVMMFALVAVAVFELVLGLLRTYVLSHTTTRIDVELGARLFRHLVNLPLAYFRTRRVGDSVARVRELENIRNFLTSAALTLVLDLVFMFVFIAVMAWYSVTLTCIVLAALPCYALLAWFVSPVFRRRLDDKFARGAENQAFLVEAVSGMETIKAMAVEPQMQRRWDNQLAAYVGANFRVTQLANIYSQSSQLINKLMVAAILYVGARLVMANDLSVGQLIAFNMLAMRVSSPVLRLVQMWQDFQQTGVSVRRLGDILNTRTELAGRSASAALPPIRGDIQFDGVHFRYRPEGVDILCDVAFRVQAGEVVGVVGRSGSGKSTIARLVQRLYSPTQGRVLIDGQDITLADPAWLRRQVGVVLQENLLFNRSIRENIALADPGMPLEHVMRAAKLAGAHDFIVEFAEGYDTMVGEQGTSLSGGQRQRIALARALVSNPRILVLDEATSALDYESERIIQDNMKEICRGRTVIIIAHRLSALRDAGRILVMDRGRLVEQGAPDELLARPGSVYAHLFAEQAGHAGTRRSGEVTA